MGNYNAQKFLIIHRLKAAPCYKRHVMHNYFKTVRSLPISASLVKTTQQLQLLQIQCTGHNPDKTLLLHSRLSIESLMKI